MLKKPKTFIKKVTPELIKKPTQAKKESPSNPRIIAEFSSFLTYTDTSLFVSVLSGMVIVGIVMTGMLFLYDIQILSVYRHDRTQRAEEFAYWQGIVNKYPDYRDAYVKEGMLAYTLGDMTTAKHAIEKAREIDPNFEVGNQLAKEFGE